MPGDHVATSKEVNEGANEMTNTIVKKEPMDESAPEELNPGNFEYPVESIYVKEEPAEEITCEINPLEGNGFELSDDETADEASTMRRFIFANQSLLGSYRKTERPPPSFAHEDRLSLRHEQPIDTLEKLKRILHPDDRSRRRNFASRSERAARVPPRADETTSGSDSRQRAQDFASRSEHGTHASPHDEETTSRSGSLDHRQDFASMSANETGASQAATPRPRPFVCPDCNKTFAQTSNLKDHILTHTGERPFGCPQCGWRFKHGSHLKSHLKTHVGVRHFGCHICARRFIRASDLRNHIVLHAGEKPFCCQDCKKRFSRKDHLSRHTRTFHAAAESGQCHVEGQPT